MIFQYSLEPVLIQRILICFEAIPENQLSYKLMTDKDVNCKVASLLTIVLVITSGYAPRGL